MVYPETLLTSLQKVEASREQRLNQSVPRIVTRERDTLLKTFHPDYIADAFRELRLGPNKGQRAPHELVSLLESPPILNPESVDLDAVDMTVDVLVIGGGGSGASAALLAREHGKEVLLTTKLRFGDSNTIMAQGGIQAAVHENDSLAIHYLDVMGGGRFTNVPELVSTLVSDAPNVIAWLESLGVMFDRKKNGEMSTNHGGGTSRKRMHAARDYTGAEIMRNLRDEVLSYTHGKPAIYIWEFRPAIELILDNKGQAVGAVLQDLDTDHLIIVRAKAVILATGGSGRLHYQGFPTTNHYGATGDGLVLAYRVGVPLVFVDTMQYHPTGVAYPEQILGQLVTEKVRGLGAQLCNVEGEQFVYPLETRDVEAAAIIRECTERNRAVITPSGRPAIWLDTPMIDLLHGSGTITRELPAMVRQFNRHGIDMSHEPILIYPTLHYQNGGVAIKSDGSTVVPGLFVAGEAAGGIHGRNRLMGNSLLDICVFGRRAGRAAATWAAQVTQGEPSLEHLIHWEHRRQEVGIKVLRPSPLILPD